MLEVHDFYGDHMIYHQDALESRLLIRDDAHCANRFYLYNDDQAYPLLDLWVKDNMAVLYYFNQADEAPSISQSNEYLHLGERVSFHEDPNGEATGLPSSAIVSIKKAIMAAKEFSETKRIPTCIEWLDL
jgi:hypothetical protein